MIPSADRADVDDAAVSEIDTCFAETIACEVIGRERGWDSCGPGVGAFGADGESALIIGPRLDDGPDDGGSSGVRELGADSQSGLVDVDADLSDRIRGVVLEGLERFSQAMREPSIQLILIDRGGPVFLADWSHARQGAGDPILKLDPSLLSDVGVAIELCPPVRGVVELAELDECQHAQQDYGDH